MPPPSQWRHRTNGFGVTNLLLWPDRFEKQRRLVLSAGMLACYGRVQREGEVVHVVTDRLEDLSDLLRRIGERDQAFPLQYDRGDGVTHPAAPDPRRQAGVGPGREAHGVTTLDLCLAAEISVPTRDFR